MKRILTLAILGFFAVACTNTDAAKRSLLRNQFRLEQQLRLASGMQFERGNGYLLEMKTTISTLSYERDQELRNSRINDLFHSMQELDSISLGMIEEIEALKKELLKQAAIPYVEENRGDYTFCEMEDRAFSKLSQARQGDAARKLFCKNEREPSSKGLKLWNVFNRFRIKLIEALGTYDSGENQFSLKLKAINSFQNNADLVLRVKEMIDANVNANLKEDSQILLDLYLKLTKAERTTDHEKKGTHWVCATFFNASGIAALSSLTMLESDVLHTRAIALAHVKSKIMYCGGYFDQVFPLVTGPSFVKAGDELRLSISLAAYQEYDVPTVTVNDPTATISYDEHGFGLVRFKPQKKLTTLLGTLSIKNKSGVEKKESWKFDVQAKE